MITNHNPIFNPYTTGCYVLSCSNQKWYVGSTTHLSRRLNEHFFGYGHGGSKTYCGWTKLHPPKHIFYIWKTQFINHQANQTHVFTRKCSMERVFTYMCFEMFGIPNVRGHAYTTTDKDYRSSDMLIKQLSDDKFISQCMIALDFIVDKGMDLEDIETIPLCEYNITGYFDQCLKHYNKFLDTQFKNISDAKDEMQ